MTRALIVMLALLAAGPAEAQARRRAPVVPTRPVDADRFDWKRVRGAPPERSAYDQAMALADAQTVRLFERRLGLRSRDRDLQVAAIVKNYERAIAADPKQAEPHYRLAMLIFELYLSRDRVWVFEGEDRRRAEQALRHWSEFERLAPLDPRVLDLLSERAIVYTKLPSPESYDRAMADYDRAIAYLKSSGSQFSSDSVATSLANMAEVCMMRGDLDRSFRLYTQSLELHRHYLSAFGYAVALDRDGQAWKARELIRDHATEATLDEYVKRLTGQLAGSVFYVPEGEVHYYFGLIHDALGNYTIAISEFEEFIRSGSHPMFQQRARDNIADLGKRLRSGHSPVRPVKDLSWWRDWLSHQ